MKDQDKPNDLYESTAREWYGPAREFEAQKLAALLRERFPEAAKVQELHRRIQHLQSEIVTGEGGRSWHRYFTAALNVLRDSRAEAETLKKEVAKLRAFTKATCIVSKHFQDGPPRCACRELLRETERKEPTS